METDFSKLNPMLSHSELGHELTFNCPHCLNRVAIRVNLNSGPISPAIWGLFVDIDKGWQTATITPSINDHPIGLKRSGCHFSVVNGTVQP